MFSDGHYIFAPAQKCRCKGTVNVDVFAQLNFRASSPRCHFRVEKFSRILQLILLPCYDIYFHIFAHVIPCAKCANICTARTFLRLQYFYIMRKFDIKEKCLPTYTLFLYLVMKPDYNH